MKALVIAVILAASSAQAMEDKQYDFLRDIDMICLRRSSGVGTTYEKGFEHCAEIQRAFIAEYQKRQAESATQDLSDIEFYYSLYPLGRPHIAKRK